MPKCKNDTKRSYKGTEPSPKGLGWCAHAEKEAKKRKGKDGNQWIIQKTKTGTLRWIKDNISSSKNKLSSKKDIFAKGTKYFTHWNGDRPYMVIINKNKKDLTIYSQNEEYEPDKSDGELIGAERSYEYWFNPNKYKFYKEYKNLKKIWIGNDPVTTKIYKKPNEKYNFTTLGNSILAQITNNKYLSICRDIQEFTIPKDDNIIKYHSVVGNSDCPYPIAVGKINAYFMLDMEYIPLNMFPKNLNFFDEYHRFYEMKKGKKPFPSVIMLHQSQ
jgi:hypothetical protein